MSCDEIKIKDDINQITIVNTEDQFKVEDNSDATVIINNEDEFIVTDEVGETITINAVDVHIIPPQNVDLSMNCTASESVGDAVYVFANGEVRRASNSSITTAKVIGFIITKPTATSCTVRIVGTVNSFAGLTAGSQYFLGVNGAITLIPPTIPGSVLVRVGNALDLGSLLVNINNNYTIRG